MRPCTASAYSNNTAAPMNKGISIMGAIQPITRKKISAKGRSMKATTVAEPMKSRTDSKARRLEAKEPAEAGRCSMRMPSTRSMMKADSLTSARLLARSTKRLRMTLSIRSPSTMMKIPAESTHRVSKAWLGTTRS